MTGLDTSPEVIEARDKILAILAGLTQKKRMHAWIWASIEVELEDRLASTRSTWEMTPADIRWLKTEPRRWERRKKSLGQLLEAMKLEVETIERELDKLKGNQNECIHDTE